MSITAKQRRKINIQNAQKSTGPRTPEGLGISRANAINHGLTAQTLALPSEDPEVVAIHIGEWVDYYQPQNPAELALVEEAAKATLTLRRCTAREKELVENHVADLLENFEHAAEDKLADLQKLLMTDPATAARHLKRFSHGVRWMIERWQVLEEPVQNKGYFGNSALTDEAVRLLGCDPNDLRNSPVSGYLLTVADASAWNTPDERYLARLLDSKTMHPDYWIVSDGTPIAHDGARELVRMKVESELRALEGLLPKLVERKQAQLERATAGAVLPEDSPDARLLLRYHKSAEVAFHKAYKELTKILTQRIAVELENASKSVAATPETTSGEAVATALDAALRNEASAPIKPHSSNCQATSYGESSEAIFGSPHSSMPIGQEPGDAELVLAGTANASSEFDGSSERLF
jgi:hypothetical protein